MAKVCIDPGHGGSDPGAVGHGRMEKNDVLYLSTRVGAYLQGAGIEVIYTRTTDVYDDVNVKAQKGNHSGCDLFVSIHRNSFNGAAKGYESLVYDSNSGIANVVAQNAVNAMVNIGFTNRGIKLRPDLCVLRETRMPAVLFEVGFIDNAEDNQIYVSKYEQIAKELAQSIASVFNKKVNGATGGGSAPAPSPSPKPTPSPAPSNKNIQTAYQVYAGGQWWPDVNGTSNWAGKSDNVAIRGVRMNTIGDIKTAGRLKYRVHLIGRPKNEWLPWMYDREIDSYGDDFAGNLRNDIDCIQIGLVDITGYDVYYRVSSFSSGVNYFEDVKNYSEDFNNPNGYAGAFGSAMDKLQVWIVKR